MTGRPDFLLRRSEEGFWKGLRSSGAASHCYGHYVLGFARANGAWRIYVIEGAGVDPAIEQPEAFVRALRAAGAVASRSPFVSDATPGAAC
jgi:hypothetical protein